MKVRKKRKDAAAVPGSRTSAQLDFQGDDVQIVGRGLGSAQFPAGDFSIGAEEDCNLFHHTPDIEQGVAGKDLRQAEGEVAGKAFSRPLPEPELKDKGPAARVMVAKGETDVIGPFGGITVKGFKKLVSPLRRQQVLQDFF